MIKRFPWPTLLITVIKHFPWPTFLKTVNNLVLNNKKNWVLWLEKKLLLHLLSTVAIINIPGLKFQFVTKHHHWLFGQNRTSFNALLLTRIKIGVDKPTQCSKTITWCKYFLHYLFNSNIECQNVCLLCPRLYTYIPGLKSVIHIKNQYFPLILQHKTSPYIPLFEVVR